MIITRSIKLRSSRTFPGHVWRAIASKAPGVNPFLPIPFLAYSSVNSATNSGMSSRRSLKGGT